MTSPRSYDGVGYPSPSFSSGTPIYDSLVAERGVPQIAPINVPAALPPASSGYGYGNNYASGYGNPGFDSPVSNLPALPPARLALGPGPSSAPATQYIPAQQYAAAPQPPVPGYGGQQQPYLPPQRPTAPGPGPGFQQYQQAGQAFGAQGYATAPNLAAQGGYQGAPQGFNGQAAQGFQDQSFGGNQLRPAAPVAPVRPVQQQRPQYAEQGQYPQPGHQGNAY
ncbi:hypothetical protein OHV05_04565 [Kitasatospora sp. NBC_00070]|uniref:DUF6643 family protein n=1 Tax=Kitasatospora sp. NBC_00070 TaxID=2975962 RepID=UPI003255A97F